MLVEKSKIGLPQQNILCKVGLPQQKFLFIDVVHVKVCCSCSLRILDESCPRINPQFVSCHSHRDKNVNGPRIEPSGT